MKIVIDPYDKKSIGNAIEKLKAYKEDFHRKEELFVKKLAEIGVTLAEGLYEVADYDGIKDVRVVMEQNGVTARVIAYGETVGFLEFGTGVNNPEWVDENHVSEKLPPYTPPKHGTYGKGQGKNTWGWWFKLHEGAEAIHTYGNQPAEAMLTARDEMVVRVIEVAKEVWK